MRLAAEAGGPALGSERDDADERYEKEEDRCCDNTVAEYSPGGAITLICCPVCTATKHTNCNYYYRQCNFPIDMI